MQNRFDGFLSRYGSTQSVSGKVNCELGLSVTLVCGSLRSLVANREEVLLYNLQVGVALMHL